MKKEELLDQLEKTRQDTLAYFGLPDDLLSRSYQPGKWTVKEILHHIVDAETVLYDRIRRGLSNPSQVVWAFDQDAWCRELSYATIPLNINRDIYTSIRKAHIRLVQLHYDHADSFQYIHSETGLRTVKDEMEKVAWHNRHHLEQIQRAIR